MNKVLGIVGVGETRGFFGHKGRPGQRGGSLPKRGFSNDAGVTKKRSGISSGDKWMITHIVGNIHVGTSNRGVIRTVAGKIKNFGKYPRSIRRAVMKTALKAHAANRSTYSKVQAGRF